jgi:organic radical activating enzyme
VAMVESTGGESLRQREIYPLAKHLPAAGHTFLVETSGERFIGDLSPAVIGSMTVVDPIPYRQLTQGQASKKISFPLESVIDER